MSVPQKSRPPWRFLVVLALIAFGLNWAWEMVQMPAFAEMAGRPWLDTIPLCTRAALGDVAFTLGIYLTVGCGRWARTGRWPFYAAAAILGGVSGAVFERWALGAGRWSYTDRMPIVPVLGVGLWPMLQLTLLVPLSIALTRLFSSCTLLDAGRQGTNEGPEHSKRT